MYDVNYTEIVESWLGPAYKNLTMGLGLADYADTGGSDNDTFRADSPLEDSVFSQENHGSTVNPTSLLRFPRMLPSPPVSDPSWPISKCRWGWDYDTRDYDSTLVTEVNSTRAASPEAFSISF